MNRIELIPRMMATIFFVSCIVNARAQIENTHWFVGNGEYNGKILKWENNELLIADVSQMGTKETSASVSDDNGNLLFYTNGCVIFNANHEPMNNGEGLDCWVANFQSSSDSLESGSEAPNGALIIKSLSDSNQYLVIGVARSAPEIWYIHYSIVDMTAENGLGKVIIKNEKLYDPEGLHYVSGKLAAVRHANGRDWWILNDMGSRTLVDTMMNIIEFDFYYITAFLLTPSGFTDTLITIYCAPNTEVGANEGEIAISQDGSKIALTHPNKSVILLDFDRCSGLISNCNIIDTLTLPADLSTGNYFYGVEFAPEGNLLYAATPLKIFQYDLYSQDSTFVRYLAHENIYWTQSAQTNVGLSQLQLGQDGRLYFNQTKYAYWYLNETDSNWLWLHTIDHPDSLGAACGVHMQSVYVGVSSMGLPNEVNWELGALVGSECDTLDFTTALVEEQSFTATVFPNPAASEATLMLSKPASETTELVFYDVLGKAPLVVNVPKNQKYVHIDLSGLSEGVYFYRLGANVKHSLNGGLIKIR